jgi:hypothetical protein
MPKKPFGPLGIPANEHTRLLPLTYLAVVTLPKDAPGVGSTAVSAYSTSALVLRPTSLL